MKLRASTKIAIGFVVVLAVTVFGYKAITDRMILGEKFPEIKPGPVTLFGIAPDSGYHIVVANQIASLVEGAAATMAPGEMTDSTTEEGGKRKLNIRFMLEALQGDTKHLGAFIMALNDIKEGDDWPTQPVYWDAADIQKAIAGDEKLRAKLEHDLNVKLDGTPLDVVSIRSIYNGIVLRIPVPVKVLVEGERTTLVGQVLQTYRPRFAMDLVRTLSQEDNSGLHKDKDVDESKIKGYYVQEARSLWSGQERKEDVVGSLKARIASDAIAKLAAAPTDILSKARVVLNESFVNDAEMVTHRGDSGKDTYSLIMNLNEEGRRRLWQYSKLNNNSQLLFVVNGTAIAAPTIAGEIPRADVTMTNLPDGDLVRGAVETLNKYANGKGTLR